MSTGDNLLQSFRRDKTGNNNTKQRQIYMIASNDMGYFPHYWPIETQTITMTS